MTLTLERTVVIENNKLGYCLNFLQLLVLVFVCYNIYSSAAFDARVVPLGTVSYWVVAKDGYTDQVAKDEASPICMNNAQFNYDDGDFDYDDYQCRELDSMERYKKLPGNLFLRTMVEERHIGVLKAKPDTGKSCSQACADLHKSGSSPCADLHPAFDALRHVAESGRPAAERSCVR